jgi:cation:H+ antiporter
MIVSLLFVALGFTALIYGANWLVDGASSLAKKNNISDLVIGLTIVAFGTSAPELVVNSVASANGFSDIVLGNIIGSNNFNTFIILGIASLVYPIAVQNSTSKREIPISLLVALLVLALANDFLLAENSFISRADAIILLLVFAGFIFYTFSQIKKEEPEAIDLVVSSNYKIAGLIVAGFAGLAIGGQLVVDNAITIAEDLGVSQKIIALTIIAAGTSLPELVTSVVAALKKNSDIAIGNIVGSNIFNLLLVLPISSLIKPIQYNPIFNQDLLILMGGTLFIIFAILTGKTRNINRFQGFLLLSFYLGYTVFLVSKEL